MLDRAQLTRELIDSQVHVQPEGTQLGPGDPEALLQWSVLEYSRTDGSRELLAKPANLARQMQLLIQHTQGIAPKLRECGQELVTVEWG